MNLLPVAVKPPLVLALENAVVANWNELMPVASVGVINVEYHAGPESLLEYVKVWASSERGYWSLICEYWKGSLWNHIPGISFGKGYRAGNFSLRLEGIVQHQNDFGSAPQRDGSIRIYPPTETEREAAENRTEAFLG